MTYGWHAGTSSFDITPPLGIELTGYANRPGPASDVHDPLRVRALALSDGNETAALVSLDLLGLDADLIAGIQRDVERDCGLPAANVLLNCSHTHAGPATQSLRGLGRRDDPYCDLARRWASSAICLAVRRMEPACVRFGQAKVVIGGNRRERRGDGRIIIGENRGGAYDPTVYAIRADSATGRPLALWFSHATHPVTLGHENTVVTADFPGAAATQISGDLDGAAALFAQGCCGDINPVQRGSFDAIETTGRQLAGAAISAAEESAPLQPSLRATLRMLQLPLRVPEEAEAMRELEAARTHLEEVEARVRGVATDAHLLAQPRAMAEWAAAYREAAIRRTSQRAAFAVQVIRLGDAALVATSGETFVAIGQVIQSASPFAGTVVLGYSNGCLGYIPTAAAFAEGGYEVDTAFKYYGTLMVTPECEDMIVRAAREMLGRMKGDGR